MLTIAILGFQPLTMKNSSCYLFLWHKRSSSITGTCKQHGLHLFSAENVSIFNFILHATSAIISPILYFKNKTFLHQITQSEFSGEYFDGLANKTTADGYFVFASDTYTTPITNNLFECTDGSYISQQYLCDGVQDCSDNYDVTICTCDQWEANNIILNFCKSIFNKKIVKCTNLLHNIRWILP